MRQRTQVLREWVVVEDVGAARADTRAHLSTGAHTVLILKTSGHEPVDANRFGFGEADIECSVSGDVQATWRRTDGRFGGPLSALLWPGEPTTARFPFYAELTWSNSIESVWLGLPHGVAVESVGPLRLSGLSDLEPRDLQRFARAFAVMRATEGRDLRVSLRYSGVYLAPLETSKWIHVSLRDEHNREILTLAREARGNYDAPWIEVDFLFPDVGGVASAEVSLIDNDTEYSIVCVAEPDKEEGG